MAKENEKPIENAQVGEDIPKATEVVEQVGIGKKIIKVAIGIVTFVAGGLVGWLLHGSNKDEEDQPAEDQAA